MKTLVVYTSQTGFTRRYAQWLSDEMKADMYDLKEVQKKDDSFFAGYEAIVYAGWAMAGKVVKAKWFLNKTTGWKDKKIAIICVGGSPNDAPECEAMMKTVLTEEQSSYIKPFVDAIDQQVMFAEKSWGQYRVLDVEEDSMTIKVTLNSGHKMNYHSHEKRDEVWTVISGTGRTIVDGMEQPVKAGDVITMAAGCRHTVIADTKLQLIEVQLGKDISVNDKHKYELEL